MKANFKFLSEQRFWTKAGWAVLTTFALCIVFLYFFVSPRFNETLVNTVLIHPNVLPEHAEEMRALAGVEAKEVTIPAGTARLDALLYKVKGAPDVVLYSHGNAGNIDHRIEKIRALIQIGISVFAYDYRGYGKSSGEPTLKTIVVDGIAAYDFLVEKENYKPEQIVLYGESIGTGISTEIARKRKYKALILESGFSSPETRAKEKIPALNIYPSFLMMDPALDNLEYVRGKHQPLLLIAGKHDDMIPCTHSETMFAQASEPKKLLLGPNSNHNDFSKDWILYKTTIEAFLKEIGSVPTVAKPEPQGI
ncbi:MAG: alpha/beta hydrolase [Candidatus Melainabacteria bacterium]|nr:alpha/beta hydrolase [Candidatus Melainabacteria bacterium]